MLGYAVFILRYVVATLPSAFFGPYATHRGIGSTQQGFIFGAYPVGITLTSFFGPSLILALGTRRAVVLGLLGTAVTIAAFGAVPDVAEVAGLSPEQEGWVMAATYFVCGLIGALAETGCTIALTATFADRLGAITASIGTACGLGCLAGCGPRSSAHPPAQRALIHPRAPDRRSGGCFTSCRATALPGRFVCRLWRAPASSWRWRW